MLTCPWMLTTDRCWPIVDRVGTTGCLQAERRFRSIAQRLTASHDSHRIPPA